MNITKHAYKRARQRLGLNRKAFKRMVGNNKLPDYAYLIIENDCVVTVKNLLRADRNTKNVINKRNKIELII